MPVAVRNNLQTITTFNDQAQKLSVSWGQKGDRDGQDVQWVPEAILEHPKFLRAVALGILEVESDQTEIAAAVAAQAARYRSERATEDKALSELLQHQQGSEIVVTEDQMEQFIKSREKSMPADLDAEGALSAG